MKKTLTAIIVFVVVVVGTWWAFVGFKDKTSGCISSGGYYSSSAFFCSEIKNDTEALQKMSDTIMVSSPVPGREVGKSISFFGEARGTWYFEASFPVEVRSLTGELLGQSYASAEGDWMTTEKVPYSGTLSVTEVDTPQKAYLVLKKDNPSGLSEYDDEIKVPIVIK